MVKYELRYAEQGRIRRHVYTQLDQALRRIKQGRLQTYELQVVRYDAGQAHGGRMTLATTERGKR